MEQSDEALDLALWYLKTDVARLFQVVATQLGLSNQPAEWNAWSAARVARHWLEKLSLDRAAKLWQQFRKERPAAKPSRARMPKPRQHATSLTVPSLHRLAQTTAKRS